jgi:hypothetical protein
MFRIICIIVSIYMAVGMGFYGFAMAIGAWLWSMTHKVSIGEAFKQHFKKQLCVSMLIGCVFYWPGAIVVAARSYIRTQKRIDNGEFVTVIREVNEHRDEIF